MTNLAPEWEPKRRLRHLWNAFVTRAARQVCTRTNWHRTYEVASRLLWMPRPRTVAGMAIPGA